MMETPNNESSQKTKLIGTISLSTYQPKEEDICRALGTEKEVQNQNDRMKFKRN